jgi:lactose/cellobiose-specific phosphotransferase system IIC component
MNDALDYSSLKQALMRVTLHVKGGFIRLLPSESIFYLREAMIWTLPCAIMSAIFVATAFMLHLIGVVPEVVANLTSLNKIFSGLIPIIATSSLAYILSVKKRLPPMPVSLLALISTLVVKQQLGGDSSRADTFMLIIGIIIPFVVVPLVYWMYQQRWTRITDADFAGGNVKGALNLTIPGIVVFSIIFIALKALLYVSSFFVFPSFLSDASIGASYLGGILYAGLNSTLWFFGIHGANVLHPLMVQLTETSAAGMGIVNESFLGAFVFMGGCGATFSLIVSVLVFSRSKTLRLLAVASIPIGLLNVNELLLFGLPIILNPRMLTPFLVVPVVNVIVALTVIGFGWVAIPSADIPLNCLIGFNAYVATHNDFHAVGLQLFNIMLGSMIYSPFVRAVERDSLKPLNVYLKSLKMTYTHLNEEAALFADDVVQTSNTLRHAQIRKRHQLERIAELDFFLEYQPQVSVHDQKFVGAEALLRARDKTGKLIMPYEFLPWLNEAGLMKSIDLWVAGEALEQDAIWQEMGLDVPIKINITGATLSEKVATNELIKTISQAKGRISIEIIEQDFSSSMVEVIDAIKRIHAFGGKVYIDDFGTGYSSLSYLNSLNADYLKVDRSFVLALETEGGRKVMSGIFNFAEALGLSLVVEGVETEEQLSKIPNNVPFSVQGWLYSKALHPDNIPAFALKYSDT